VRALLQADTDRPFGLELLTGRKKADLIRVGQRFWRIIGEGVPEPSGAERCIGIMPRVMRGILILLGDNMSIPPVLSSLGKASEQGSGEVCIAGLNIAVNPMATRIMTRITQPLQTFWHNRGTSSVCYARNFVRAKTRMGSTRVLKRLMPLTQQNESQSHIMERQYE
jgi:hypothetical protein